MRTKNMSEPDPIDVYVGSRVRMRRTLLGKSQTNIGEALGLTFQQIQKYERGANRISSSKLYKLSKLLKIPVVYFFEEIPDQLKRDMPTFKGEKPEPFDQNQLSTDETLELVRNYYKIENTKARKKIFEFIKGIAQVRKQS